MAELTFVLTMLACLARPVAKGATPTEVLNGLWLKLYVGRE